MPSHPVFMEMSGKLKAIYCEYKRAFQKHGLYGFVDRLPIMPGVDGCLALNPQAELFSTSPVFLSRAVFSPPAGGVSLPCCPVSSFLSGPALLHPAVVQLNAPWPVPYFPPGCGSAVISLEERRPRKTNFHTVMKKENTKSTHVALSYLLRGARKADRVGSAGGGLADVGLRSAHNEFFLLRG